MMSSAQPHRPSVGPDVVLDSRKLILGFAILMVLCGGFFVFGFIEGKRQAVPAAAGAQATAPAAAGGGETQASPKGAAAETATKPVEERAVREQLDWYRSVKPKSGGADTKTTSVPPPQPAPAPAAKAPETQPAAPAAGATYYSVQVGAFRQRREAETKAESLTAKGYPFTIEPRAGDGLFLLKVGRFESRAEAVATQLRLKRDGFATLIKSN